MKTQFGRTKRFSRQHGVVHIFGFVAFVLICVALYLAYSFLLSYTGRRDLVRKLEIPRQEYSSLQQQVRDLESRVTVLELQQKELDMKQRSAGSR